MSLHPETLPTREIQQAVGEYRAALKRTRAGIVKATADVMDGMIVACRVEVENYTAEDLERMVRGNRPVLPAKGERP